MSTTTTTTEWVLFHHQNKPPSATQTTATSASDLFWSGGVSDSTVVSTTVAATATATSPHPSAPIIHHKAGPSQPGPEGRVSKPAARRRSSRASRRAPTTMLNVDTTNFRVMVQQFTGGPAPHFSVGPGSGYTLPLPMGPTAQYSINDYSNEIFMQRVGSLLSTSHVLSSENRSSHSFQF